MGAEMEKHKLFRVVFDPEDASFPKLTSVQLYFLHRGLQHTDRPRGKDNGETTIPITEHQMLHVKFDWLDAKTIAIRSAIVLSREGQWRMWAYETIKKVNPVLAAIVAAIAIGTFAVGVAAHIPSVEIRSNTDVAHAKHVDGKT
jgi:hypothetical protein